MQPRDLLGLPNNGKHDSVVFFRSTVCNHRSARVRPRNAITGTAVDAMRSEPPAAAVLHEQDVEAEKRTSMEARFLVLDRYEAETTTEIKLPGSVVFWLS